MNPAFPATLSLLLSTPCSRFSSGLGFFQHDRPRRRPSFRDEEVVWENMRVLPDGEAVSVDGTHLGHNIPDGKGNRYCINLVSVAGLPGDDSPP